MMVSVMKNGIYKIRTLISDFMHLDRNLYIIKYSYEIVASHLTHFSHLCLLFEYSLIGGLIY